MKFFNLGASELLLIVLFAFLAVGPKETIRLAAQAREILGNIQGVLSEVTTEVTKVAADVMEMPEDNKK